LLRQQLADFMARVTKKITRPRRGATQFPGIVADAASLGVNRIHLYRVLIGARDSKPLMARYRELQAAKAGGVA
jgi:hypothetical protein